MLSVKHVCLSTRTFDTWTVRFLSSEQVRKAISIHKAFITVACNFSMWTCTFLSSLRIILQGITWYTSLNLMHIREKMKVNYWIFDTTWKQDMYKHLHGIFHLLNNTHDHTYAYPIPVRSFTYIQCIQQDSSTCLYNYTYR